MSFCQDKEFVECVVADINQFVNRCRNSRSVLVFPPVNSYRRFLIHKVSEDYSEEVSTFSIGQGHGRRTVVCFNSHLIRDLPQPRATDDPVSNNLQPDKGLGSMVFERQNFAHQGSGTPYTDNHVRRARAAPSVGIYRPPAARRLAEQIVPLTAPRCTSPAAETKPEIRRPARQRRPDIQVYVPRAKRLAARERDGDDGSTARTRSWQQMGNQALGAQHGLCSSICATAPQSSSSAPSEEERKSRATDHRWGMSASLWTSHHDHSTSLRQHSDRTCMEVSCCTESVGQPAELNDSCSDMDVEQDLSTEDVQSVYRRHDGKHMRAMKDCLLQIEGEGIRRKFTRRASNSSLFEQSGRDTPIFLHEGGQVLDDSVDSKNVDRISETGQLCHGNDIRSSARPSSNRLESNSRSVGEKREWGPTSFDSEDLSEDFTDEFLGEIGVGPGSVRSSSAGNSSRSSPSSAIGNETESSDCENKDTANSFQTEVLSCELDTQNPCEGNITEDSGFGSKSLDVSLNLEEPDSAVKASDDDGEFRECSDAVREETAFDRSDSFNIDTDLSSVDSKECHDDAKDRMCIETVPVSNDFHKKDENEGCRAQKEQNRRNRRVIRGSVMSDVLIISDPDPVADVTVSRIGSGAESSLSPSCVVNKKKVQQKGDIAVETPGPTSKEHSADEHKSQPLSVNLNPDECTWDMMFDDNGDCLDPKLMEELTNSVGLVTIEKPQSDYRSYQSRVELLMSGAADDELSHVLEIHSFPAEFKTHDLLAVFSPYMKGGFEIKWVDDTHALGVFSSALVAAEVLAADHPFVKTRPLHEATPESRLKARRSTELLQPHRARPETCAALARRLVTGALGLRLNTTREEREAERRLLSEAREKKRLAARQRDEAWEGTLCGK